MSDLWADVLNGELFALAEENSFDVLLTADTNIKSQQNLSNRRISILVLRAFNNCLATNAKMTEDIQETLAKIQPGEIVEVLHKDIKAKSM